MGSFYAKRRVERTRKIHNCYDCGKTIPKGSTCVDSATVYDGNFMHGYFCSECVEVPVKTGGSNPLIME